MKRTHYQITECTHLGVVAGVALYENPEYGDEAPILVAMNGALVETCFWDMPESDELTDHLTDLRAACRAG